MAFNNYPINYPYYQYPQQQIPQTQLPGTQMSLPQQMQQPQIQNGGLIAVRSEEEARNFPVAPGTSVTFIDESRRNVFAKTMGFSQLDRPIFEKYKLVKDEPQNFEREPESTKDDKSIAYAEKTEIEVLQEQIDDIRNELEELRRKQAPKKKEAE